MGFLNSFTAIKPATMQKIPDSWELYGDFLHQKNDFSMND